MLFRSAAPAAPAVQIPDGPVMHQGDNDRRVVLLRKRLQLADQTSTKYDREVADAVKDFQDKNGLDSDGSVGSMTLTALNGAPAVKTRGHNHVADTLLANLERWRWVPHELGKSHVVLNIANFTLKVFNKGDKIWETRVVVGKPSTPTPILSETMKYITVNPTWNVPPSIVYNEYLPVRSEERRVGKECRL